MATHRVLVITQHPGGLWYQGDEVDYDGPPDWKFEPLDPIARFEWQVNVSEPDRVDEENRRNPPPDWLPARVQPVDVF